MKEEKQLIIYIESMLHSCLKTKGRSHLIAVCPDRKIVVASFLKKYNDKQWMPAEEWEKVSEPASVKKERESVGVYGRE